jgi:hypothetical protein
MHYSHKTVIFSKARVPVKHETVQAPLKLCIALSSRLYPHGLHYVAYI